MSDLQAHGTALMRRLADAVSAGIVTGHDWPNNQDELTRLQSARLLREAAEELDRLRGNPLHLLDRAEALHLNAGMPWHEAHRLALSEAGVDDAAIVELVGECAVLGRESLLTGEEICDFARAVLVHGSPMLPTTGEGQ